MKKLAATVLLLFCLLPGLLGETAQEIEKRLKMSSPGLPEFRVYIDFFGVVRSVRSVAGKTPGGVFKVSLLANHPRISMMDISGVQSVELEGLDKFKELRSLRLGASQIKGLEKYAMPHVVRLDLANSRITDISWMKNFPGVRTLHLPESVTDISALKGRSFRALSVPGVRNSDDICRALKISVDIRTARVYRRPGRDAMPPVELQRTEKGAVKSFAFTRFTPPRRKYAGFAGNMFPEELAPRRLPPEAQEYPGIKELSRREPFKAALLLKESASLQRLDLRALECVEFAGETFPELQELYLSGSIIGLETLKAPRLKRVVLADVEGWLPGEKRNPRRWFRRSFPEEARKNVKFVRINSSWPLEELRISLRRAEFDFDSLKGVPLKVLDCRYPGTTLAFLRGQTIRKLFLYAPLVNGSETAVLGTLPLKELNVTFGSGADCRFLQKLKLQTLTLCGGRNFSAALLRRMPLRFLRLRQELGRKIDLNSLKAPALQELVLDQVHFTRAEFLGKLPHLRSLALENCIFSPADLDLNEPDLEYVCGDRISKGILRMKKLKNLRIGRIGVFGAGDRSVNIDFPWERFKALKVENLSLCAERADFARYFKSLKCLKIDDISRHGILPEQVRTHHLLETLSLTNFRPRPDRAVPERNSFFRRPMIPVPREEPGIARRLYLDGPGGFQGGFLL
ncbi:MAG: hypothetical protein J6S54_07025 [Lentisphaeria bacterium]|nr:hypothetical protein [Lentisphaeria bacterium]